MKSYLERLNFNDRRELREDGKLHTDFVDLVRGDREKAMVSCCRGLSHFEDRIAQRPGRTTRADATPEIATLMQRNKGTVKATQQVRIFPTLLPFSR